MSIIVPPIKSQGIKTKLVPWINDLIKHSDLKLGANWIEPFFGTGVVGFNAPVMGEHIVGDTNPHLMNFYQCIYDGDITAYTTRMYLEQQGRLLSAAMDDGYEHYKMVRDRFNSKHSPYDFLFLSRAGFNGMMRFNRKGEWNIPFCKKPERFAPAYITKICNQVDKVERVMRRSRWRFLKASYIETLAYATEDDFIYCDPPYYGRYVDYYNGWTEKDEEQLFYALKSTRAKFVLSTWHHNEFRENSMIKRFWGEFNMETMGHFYHSGGKLENRHSVVEALVFNFERTQNRTLEQKPVQLALEF